MLREDTGDLSPTTGFRASNSPPPPPPPPPHHPPQNSVLDDIFGEPTTALPAAQQPAMTTSSQLDDIFGCSPPRDAAGGPIPHEDGAPGWTGAAASRDVSDIPRLRSVHVTAGYRDGLAESKAGHVQDGFDEGFPLGAVLGMKAGWALGVLEGVAVAFRAAALGKGKGAGGGGGGKVEDAAEAFEAARRQLVDARKELGMVSLFGQEYFDEEGIWKYHVDGREDEVTFEEVAAQHPLVSKWLVAVDALVEKARVDLRILDRRAREDADDETTTVG